jgi:hypothetical protein
MDFGMRSLRNIWKSWGPKVKPCGISENMAKVKKTFPEWEENKFWMIKWGFNEDIYCSENPKLWSSPTEVFGVLWYYIEAFPEFKRNGISFSL